MLNVIVKRIHSNVAGVVPKAVFNNGKDEVVATTPGTYLLYGDVPPDVKCKTIPADAVCEYTVEPR